MLMQVNANEHHFGGQDGWRGCLSNGGKKGSADLIGQHANGKAVVSHKNAALSLEYGPITKIPNRTHQDYTSNSPAVKTAQMHRHPHRTMTTSNTNTSPDGGQVTSLISTLQPSARHHHTSCVYDNTNHGCLVFDASEFCATSTPRPSEYDNVPNDISQNCYAAGQHPRAYDAKAPGIRSTYDHVSYDVSKTGSCRRRHCEVLAEKERHKDRLKCAGGEGRCDAESSLHDGTRKPRHPQGKVGLSRVRPCHDVEPQASTEAFNQQACHSLRTLPGDNFSPSPRLGDGEPHHTTRPRAKLPTPPPKFPRAREMTTNYRKREIPPPTQHANGNPRTTSTRKLTEIDYGCSRNADLIHKQGECRKLPFLYRPVRVMGKGDDDVFLEDHEMKKMMKAAKRRQR